MSVSLNHSYHCCQRIARRADSSFYRSFWLLPHAKRRAMWALYAFSRQADDLGDAAQPAQLRRQSLIQWRQSLHRALEGHFDHPCMPALADTIHRYQIPEQYLFDILDGVEMDLQPSCRFATFGQLDHYCYLVASAVGLACVHIWGFRSEKIFEPAKKCGLAFQLTNILRDLKEDAQRDRIYLPLEELERFRYEPHELLQGVVDERFTALMHFEIRRAEQLYDEAAEVATHLQHDGRRVFRSMYATYRELLKEIKRRNGDVFSRPIQLGWPKKLAITLAQWV